MSRPRALPTSARAVVFGIALMGIASPLSFAMRAAHAQERTSTREVIVDRGDVTDPELELTLRELFQRNHLLYVDITGTGSERRGLARVTLRVTGDGISVMVVRDEKNIAREVKMAQSTALTREIVAHVVLSAVDPAALAAESKPPEPAPEKPEEPPAVPKEAPPAIPERSATKESARKSALSFAFGLHGGPALPAEREAAVNFLASARLVYEGSPRVAIGVEGGGALPQEIDRAGTHGTFNSLPLRARVAIEFLSRDVVRLEVGASAGIEVQRFRAETFTEGATVVSGGSTLSSSSRVEPLLGGFLAARFRLSREIDLVTTGGLEVDLATRRWTTSRPEATIVESSRVRPYGLIGIEWTLLGEKSSSLEAMK